jgi:D-alanyl-D-alanine carboxypeptidase/D-alanyl-D-alanine-endopeptidase (penicillin-binding protein 4)
LPRATSSQPARPALAIDLDAIFDSPALARALVAVRVDSLGTGRTLYARNAGTLVIPASNMKIVTTAVAAARLGWDFRFETRLDAVGPIRAGELHGDLVAVGSGDPSIGAPDLLSSPVFDVWVDAVRAAGIRHVDGRLVGDDGAFDQETLGAGWAWDYLAAGYAAPSGALSYNENVAVVRVSPAVDVGRPARVTLGPPGTLLDLANRVTTGPAGSAAALSLVRLPGSARLTIGGQVPAGGATLVRTAAVDDPTRVFVEALRIALATHGIGVDGGAWDIDDLTQPVAAGPRQVVARHRSEPLSSLVGYAMKVSQNFYGDMFLKAVGRSSGGEGSAESGRQVVRNVLAEWQMPTDSLVMYDGSGLSRYNYATADLLVAVLGHVWRDPALRGHFMAALPLSGHDGTLESRMRGTALDRRVQAKTGTISNVRALSGYLAAASGDTLAFAMIANNFIAPNAAVDAVMEAALGRLLDAPR